MNPMQAMTGITPMAMGQPEPKTYELAGPDSITVVSIENMRHRALLRRVTVLQTLPEPDAHNTRLTFEECENRDSYENHYRAKAVFHANGRTFRARVEEVTSFKAILSRSEMAALPHRLCKDVKAALRQEIADWLAAVNPIPND